MTPWYRTNEFCTTGTLFERNFGLRMRKVRSVSGEMKTMMVMIRAVLLNWGALPCQSRFIVAVVSAAKLMIAQGL